MTWVTDHTGTRWVEPVPRKRRKASRAVRFADLAPGDVLIHRSKWKHEIYDRTTRDLSIANDNARTEQGQVIGFAFCEHRWFDPVRGERDDTAGQMAAVRAITGSGRGPSLYPHTLRGLAQNGYWPATSDQSATIRTWLAQREAIIARYDAGELSVEEARAGYKPWVMMLRECGLDAEHQPPVYAREPGK